jgi:phosphoribosylaminoimidazole-succinocarboxamide synthase
MNTNVCMKTDLPFPCKRGKVRDVYDLGNELLIIATDRISAFDCVLPNGIPHKGKALTQMSLFWYQLLADLIPNHLITADIDDYPIQLQEFRDVLIGRSMLVVKANPILIECVARGYITGSGWEDYLAVGEVCGIQLKKGLLECEKLAEPIFTPATKAETGHDENISYEKMGTLIGANLAAKLRDLTLQIYRRAAAYADDRGIIICDTKLEFGIIDHRIFLIDEVLTSDSSRFWPKDQYESGHGQPSFDKQEVRDYLTRVVKWNKKPPAPELPLEVVAATSKKYLKAYRLLTGQELVI